MLPGRDRTPVVTAALLVANLLVFAAAQRAGAVDDAQALLDFGAMFGPLIADGEYWRLLTAMFLHADLLHLLFNMLALFLIGRQVEKSYGHLRFGVIYLLAGLSGSVLSFMASPLAIGAGASGAIFGALGALVAFYVVQRRALGSQAKFYIAGLVVMVSVSLAYGLAAPRIDNWAHLGGLAGGVALGLALSPRTKPMFEAIGSAAGLRPARAPAPGWWMVPAVAAVLAAGALAGTLTTPDNPHTRLFRAERHAAAGDNVNALIELNLALRMERSLARAYYLRGTILAEQGNIAAAISELGAAVRYGQATDPATRSEALSLMLQLRGQR